MDEAFASTSAYDGLTLSEELLKYFAHIGCKCVFSTHNHDLANKTGEISNFKHAKVKISNLTAEIRGGERTFRIERGTPEGHSHAKDVAEKYGLIFSFLEENL